MTKTKNIGIDVKAPKEECTDAKCPFHGNLKVRGKTITGFIVSKDVHTSASLESESRKHIKKYDRYLKTRAKVRVHNPPCINAQVGDKVRAMECRPLSKTKTFTIIEKIGHDIFKEEEIKEEKEEKKKKKEMKEEETPKDTQEKEEASE